MGFMYDGSGGNGADTYKGQEAYNVLQNFLSAGESSPATDFIVWHINKNPRKMRGFFVYLMFCFVYGNRTKASAIF